MIRYLVLYGVRQLSPGLADRIHSSSGTNWSAPLLWKLGKNRRRRSGELREMLRPATVT